MLVWINGPFGGGKTAAAAELHRRVPGSVICDPEHLGFGLRRMLPPAMQTDFQDLPAWRSGVREILDLVLRECLARLSRPEFADHIQTDRLTAPQVADVIARGCGLPIAPDTDGPLRAALRRRATTLRHIRFD